MKNRNILLALLVLSVFSLAAVLFIQRKPTKVVYVNMDQLFNGFQMKKELESDFQKKSNSLQIQLDKSRMKITEFKSVLESGVSQVYLDSLTQMNALFASLSEQYDQEFTPLKEKYDTQIQNQLLEYVNEFGKSKGYDLILTSLNGSTVLYGAEEVNVTSEVLVFMNEKYAGK